MPRCIALIGLRGSGKTAVGKEIARLVDGTFVDTDELVVQAAGKTIAQIFASGGESEFRRLERDAVRRAVAQRPAVLSLGGGAVLDPQNLVAIKSIATVVWLTAPTDVLWQRVQADATSAPSRPSLTDKDGLAEMRQLLHDRTPIYAQAADMIIDTACLTVQEVARKVIAESATP